jgi:hypothetical protein
MKASLSSYRDGLADAAPATRARGGEIIDRVDTVVKEVATKQDGITASNVLSDAGKSEADGALANATASKLSFVKKEVSGLESDLAATQAVLYDVKPPAKVGADPLLQFLYGKEIRDSYKGLTQNEVDAAFVAATQQDADEDSADQEEQAVRDAIVWAMLQAPVPMVSETIRDRVLAERAQHQNPATWARLQQVDLLRENLSGLRETLVAWLTGLGGDPAVIFEALGGTPPAESNIESARKMVQHA